MYWVFLFDIESGETSPFLLLGDLRRLLLMLPYELFLTCSLIFELLASLSLVTFIFMGAALCLTFDT